MSLAPAVNSGKFSLNIVPYRDGLTAYCLCSAFKIRAGDRAGGLGKEAC